MVSAHAPDTIATRPASGDATAAFAVAPYAHATVAIARIYATRPVRALTGLVAYILTKVHLGDLGPISVLHNVLGLYRLFLHVSLHAAVWLTCVYTIRDQGERGNCLVLPIGEPISGALEPATKHDLGLEPKPMSTFARIYATRPARALAGLVAYILAAMSLDARQQLALSLATRDHVATTERVRRDNRCLRGRRC